MSVEADKGREVMGMRTPTPSSHKHTCEGLNFISGASYKCFQKCAVFEIVLTAPQSSPLFISSPGSTPVPVGAETELPCFCA